MTTGTHLFYTFSKSLLLTSFPPKTTKEGARSGLWTTATSMMMEYKVKSSNVSVQTKIFGALHTRDLTDTPDSTQVEILILQHRKVILDMKTTIFTN